MLAPGGIRLRRGFNDPGAATMVAAPAISLFAVAESASTSIPPSDAPIASRPGRHSPTGRDRFRHPEHQLWTY
ncbi:hypothetical protein I545_6101 [Mycobacterium kansasii 662]|uniref:Uncharacterized protein n=2 Tax=Mycobacterium kansasii TaxID=1768 RepID=A0A1V3XDL4_MYCKA|nr:hypothetical protein I545_6101 [Mycobacterium kansasii 662]KEP40965.1 hypothetical protein MKSMC1_38840 [Mycobacterium kansasii]OOK74034.1 hypothetical protein BZL30_4686 [Mycobacterium kansasii]OOK77178.1 hypothetical protein BZL29_4044 [Mycobacterium kansasii]